MKRLAPDSVPAPEPAYGTLPTRALHARSARTRDVQTTRGNSAQGSCPGGSAQHAVNHRGRRRARRGRLIVPAALACLLAALIGLVFELTSTGFTPPLGMGPAGDAHIVDDEKDWCLILVNEANPLPDDYAVTTTSAPGGERIDVRIYAQLHALFGACEQAGFSPFVRSGYRTRAEQEQVLSERIRAYRDEGLNEDEALAAARQWVAQPGTSEHETGLAVDINDLNGDDGIYAWLAEHAHEYGFVQRYPEDKTGVTGISNEPWHYRYVGREAAAEMERTGEVLEEYLRD